MAGKENKQVLEALALMQSSAGGESKKAAHSFLENFQKSVRDRFDAGPRSSTDS